MKRRPFIACLASSALAGCLGTLPGMSSSNGGLKITGIRHDDSSNYSGISEVYTYEHVVVTNNGDSVINLDGTVLQYDDSHRVSLPQLSLESGAKLIMISRDVGSSGVDTKPPVHIRSAGFDHPETVLESPGTITLQRENGDTIDEQEY